MGDRSNAHRSNVWGEESPTRAEIRRRHGLGESVRDIAEALDISTQAVYRHLRDMRKSDKAAS